MKTCIGFGDSLTSGYPNYFPSFMYPDQKEHGKEEFQFLYWLQHNISKDTQIDTRFEMINRGIPGNTTGQMLRRLNRDVLALDPDYVIIMGGSNDIFQGYSTELIVSKLRDIHLKCHNRGITTIGMTIPSVSGNSMMESHLDKLVSLANSTKKLLQAYDIPSIDLFDSLSSNDTRQIKTEYVLDDGVHLSLAAYKKIGQLLFDEIFFARLR